MTAIITLCQTHHGSRTVKPFNFEISGIEYMSQMQRFWKKHVFRVFRLCMLHFNSSSVNDFKINLQVFKIDCISKGVTENHHHWSVSDELISKIEGGNYLENKKKFNEYVWFNPYVAKKRFINLN